MIVIRKQPDKFPEVINVENTLEALQEQVGGYIETGTFASAASGRRSEQKGVAAGNEATAACGRGREPNEWLWNARERRRCRAPQQGTFATDACFICDEEGRLKDKPYNVELLGVPFFGTVLAVGVNGEEFADLTSGQIGTLMLTMIHAYGNNKCGGRSGCGSDGTYEYG